MRSQPQTPQEKEHLSPLNSIKKPTSREEGGPVMVFGGEGFLLDRAATMTECQQSG